MRYINKNDVLIIARNSGKLMIGIGLLCLVPIIVDLLFLEFNIIGYLIPGLISIGLGLICLKALDKYKVNKMRLKHGMIISALSWLWASLICGLALYLITGISPVDSVFESMSALTGSGITIYSDVEALPYGILFFRAFQQWIGGLGIIVLILAFLAQPGTSSFKLYNSEAREDQIKPSTTATLKETLKIYVFYTCLGIALYTLAGMPFFDSICNTFCIISTGGMSVKNANIGYYNDYIIYFITMLLMILGATSFLVHSQIIKTKGKSLIGDLQFKVMLSLIAISTLLIYFTSTIIPMDMLFTVVSSITTTGASIPNSTVMAAWPPFVLFIIMTLMLIGGSTGSTVGAIKLMRVITFSKGIYKNLREIISPQGAVIPLDRKDKKFTEKLVEQSGNYITLYFLCILISWSLLCLYGHDPFNSLFFTFSMQGNIGLEIGQLSQTIEWPLKIVGMLNMWTGRLEIYPVLITFRAIFEVFKK
ncbi:TrkH family potassium uptake protein [Methanobrevibacter sp. UBA212]|jgi:trk system potassium uptake protein TrkH|uniref:TrkH family potassium uptake protein n=1 Tax=Methanobrevibacter sp. UBA212 TaxID=1915476 RepID=UPI0025E17209|nr:TrkH family potassium uptake protein [Methanobrevibacter sp. UBA212]